ARGQCRARLEINRKKEPPRLAFTDARTALTCKTQYLALQYALGDAHIEAVLLHHDVTLLVDRRNSQCQDARSTSVGVLERDQDLRVPILAAHVEARAF